MVFGREDRGLTNDELKCCNLHLNIPSDAAYSSLNLAMAVQVVAYELYQAFAEVTPMPGWDRSLATTAEVEALFEHIQQTLELAGFLDVDNPGQTMTRLRRLLLRVQMDETEVQILRGVFKALTPPARAE